MKFFQSLTYASLATFCIATGMVDVAKYSIDDDPVHEQWWARSLESRDQRVNFSNRILSITVAGYTYTYSADQVRNTINSCREFQGGQARTGTDCLDNALRLAGNYSIIGALGYRGIIATVGLMQHTQGLANTINGDQGQGPSSRRHARDLDARDLEKRCSVRNGNLYTNDHYWQFIGDYGLKIQCKNGCGDTNYDRNSMNQIINYLALQIRSSNDLNAQFTVYDNTNGRVFARCKTTFEDVNADTCPENIDGHGCNF